MLFEYNDINSILVSRTPLAELLITHIEEGEELGKCDDLKWFDKWSLIPIYLRLFNGSGRQTLDPITRSRSIDLFLN